MNPGMHPLVMASLAFAAALVLAGLVCVLARRMHWMDHPTHRGLHDRPTPTLGGLAIVTVCLAMVCWSVEPASDLADVIPTLSIGALLIAGVGCVDDLHPLPIAPRLLVHFLATALMLWACGGLHAIAFDSFALDIPPPAQLLVLVGMVWFVNLFNFMDGIDGIAASEAVFIAGCAAVFCWMDGQAELALLWAVFAGAAGGFLVWNWAPAKLFMGDVGSGFVGFMVASLLILSVNAGALNAGTALALGSVFFVDATTTLLRRFLAGERWYSGHRTHAYQRLARRWSSHAPVVVVLWAINLLLVAPVAWAIEVDAVPAGPLVAALLALLAGASLAVGAGRSE